jgi:hypothetical protein
MKRLTAALAVVAVLSGCSVTDLGGVLGLMDSTDSMDSAPVVERQKLDCDLIFPPVSVEP